MYQSSSVNEAPPSFEESMRLPPTYEQAIYDAHTTAAYTPDTALLQRNPGFESGPVHALDLYHSERLRIRIGLLALVLLLINVVVIIVSLAGKRHFGAFFAANCASLLVFLVGCSLAYPWQPTKRIVLAQIYFFSLMLALAVGVVMFFVFIADVREHVAKYCKHMHNGAANRWCTTRQDTLRRWAVAFAVGGVLGYSLIFSHYARVTFVYCVSVTRQFQSVADRMRSRSYRCMWAIARFLPRYAHLWRRTSAWCQQACSFSCETCGACLDACSCRKATCEDCLVWSCCACCCVSLLISLILCAAGTGAWSQFGCVMMNFILNVLGNIH